MKSRKESVPVGFDIRGVIFRAGGAAAVARACEITSSAVRRWTRVPTKHAMKVSKLAGLPPEVVRPDMASALRAPPAQKARQTTRLENDPT